MNHVASQLKQLQYLLESVRNGENRFYQQKLAESGLNLPLENLDVFFQNFPLTTKAQLIADQQAHPPYGTNLTQPGSDYVRYHQTSGTSGAPLRWLDTSQSWQWMVDNWVQIFKNAGVDNRDRVMLAFSFGPFLGFWTAFEAAACLGCLCLPGGGMSSEARLRLMATNKATVLCCTPTYALRLGETAAGMDEIDLHDVRRILVAGEPGGGIPEVRNRIESLFPSAKLIDHHGMTEVGPVSYTTPDDPDRLCILEHSYIAEILNPESGEQVKSGQKGELILTTLGRVASPLIRYRTGDLVQSGSQPLANYRLPGGILGRIDDMILVRGVNIYPSAVENVIRKFPEIAEYRVIIRRERDMTELEIQVEPASENNHPMQLATRLEAELRNAFSLRIPVRPAPLGSLPRFEMKAKRWIKES